MGSTFDNVPDFISLENEPPQLYIVSARLQIMIVGITRFFQHRYLHALAEFETAGNRIFALASLGLILYCRANSKCAIYNLIILLLGLNDDTFAPSDAGKQQENEQLVEQESSAAARYDNELHSTHCKQKYGTTTINIVKFWS